MIKKYFLSGIIACFLNCMAVAQVSCDSLTTTIAGGNGWNGNMFDVTALQPVTITGFECHFETTVLQTFTVEVYDKSGTYVGSQATASDWTLVGSYEVSSNGAGVLTPLPKTLNISIPANTTRAFYLTVTNVGVNMNYTDGTTLGSVYADNTIIQVKEGLGLAYKFGSTGGTPKQWNGKIHYCETSSGEKDIEEKDFDVEVFPNPFANDAMFSINSSYRSNESVKIEMYDMLGNTVKSLADIHSNKVKIARGGLPSGIYFYRVGQGVSKKTGKLVIE